jgi:site-specific DNA recombinase
LGYDKDKETKTLKINDREAELVREIFDLYSKERSALLVASILNGKGYTTKQFTRKSGAFYGGIPFNKPNINYILNNIIYAGKVRYADQVYQGVHEAIISEETFNKTQEILATNRVRRQAQKNSEIVSLLNHFLRCKHCNKIMFQTYTLKGDKKYRYYVCNGAQKRGYKECPTRSVNAQAIEDAVIANLRSIANSVPEQMQRVTDLKEQIESDLASIEKEQDRLDRSIGSLTDKMNVLKDSLPDKGSEKEVAALKEALKEQEQQLSSLHIKRAELHEQMITKEELQRAMVITSPLWDTLFPQEKKRVIDYLVKEIDYDGPTGTLGITLNANGIKLLCTELSQVKG